MPQPQGDPEYLCFYVLYKRLEISPKQVALGQEAILQALLTFRWPRNSASGHSCTFKRQWGRAPIWRKIGIHYLHWELEALPSSPTNQGTCCDLSCCPVCLSIIHTTPSTFHFLVFWNQWTNVGLLHTNIAYSLLHFTVDINISLHPRTEYYNQTQCNVHVVEFILKI